MHCMKNSNTGVKEIKATAASGDVGFLVFGLKARSGSHLVHHPNQSRDWSSLAKKQSEEKAFFCSKLLAFSFFLRHEVHNVHINPTMIPVNAQNATLSRPLYQLVLLPITAFQPSSCSPQRLTDWRCWSHISADNTKNLVCTLSAALKSHYQVDRHHYLFIPLGITVCREVPCWRSCSKSL